MITSTYSKHFTSLLQAVKEIENLSTTDLEKWPMYATTVAKCSPDVDGKMEYQCQEIKNFSAAKSYYTSHCMGRSQTASRLGWHGLIYNN